MNIGKIIIGKIIIGKIVIGKIDIGQIYTAVLCLPASMASVLQDIDIETESCLRCYHQTFQKCLCYSTIIIIIIVIKHVFYKWYEYHLQKCLCC